MFFKFNNISGRVGATNQATAYAPQGLTATQAEPSPFKFMNNATQAASIPEAPASAAEAAAMRGFVPAESGYASSIIETQKRFSAQDGVIVWKKLRGDRGAGNIASAVMGVIGTGYLLALLWKMSWPKKKED